MADRVASDARYRQSEKGRARDERYEQSEKARARYARYNRSVKGLARQVARQGRKLELGGA